MSGSCSVFTDLQERILACMYRDQPGLQSRWQKIMQRQQQGKPAEREPQSLEQELQLAEQRIAKRRAALPMLDYPADLPVSAQRQAIAEQIAGHQVVVVAGETGSGKTTQLPKICLELGRGLFGQIAHTQPRRIAARAVATRIAEELKTPLGHAVGYKVRFTDRSSTDSYLKLMTDGILLAEIGQDPQLLAYDTIIIDEAHERSLNIDFLLGYLHKLLPQRPELKLVITSATINTARFAEFFSNAPVLEVSGRTYPVEVRYRPLLAEDEDSQDRDLPQAIIDAVDELGGEDALGDILTFLPGEREIRSTAEELRKHALPHTEILPLYGRLSASEQDRIFRPHKGRRIVLATNVAETSLTVPGIRFVIDSGLARISRYSPRSKVQRLPVEAISQASANQRAGRCGRLANGICLRLYSEADFQSRNEFTDPEIRRTNLASVILQMGMLGLGKAEDFPFPEPPDGKAINDGFHLLQELGAVDRKRHITPLGRKLARLPLDPRLGRMLFAAAVEGSLQEVLVIVSALAAQDPRERPLEKQQQADQLHARFSVAGDRSDFFAWLKLWAYYHEQARHLTQRKLRSLCRDEFLSFVRLREWHDIHGQLLALCHEMKLSINNEAAGYEAIHRALLAGLLGNIARQQEDKQFLGARQVRLHVFPGSSQFKKPPKWLMAAELVETSRLYARTVAAIEPEWLESIAAHLLRRSYSEPHWQKRASRVAAYERVTLYGLPIVEKRRVNYGPIDPRLAREIFIREALVAGEFHTRAGFLAHNRRLIAEVEELEARLRKRELLVDEQQLFGFYDQRLPEHVHDGRHFEKWYREAECEQQGVLYMTREFLLQQEAGEDACGEFPDILQCNGLPLRLTYHFSPGDADDGVTAIVPLAALAQIETCCFDRLVPGLLGEKLVALIKSLPKGLRKNFVPAVNFSGALLEVLSPRADLLDEVSHHLQRMTGVVVSRADWQPDAIAAHLHMNYRIVDERGKVLAEGRDLALLQEEMSGRVRHTLLQARSERKRDSLERDGIREWDFDELPESVEVQRQGLTLRVWPALQDDDESVSIRLFESAAAAQAVHADGLLRLFMLCAREPVKYLRKNLPGLQTLCLHYAAYGRCEDLREDCLLAICREAFIGSAGLPVSKDGFHERLEEGKKQLQVLAQSLCSALGDALASAHVLGKRLKGNVAPALLDEYRDVAAHMQDLLHPHFVRDIPFAWLLQYPRYFTAMQARLDKAGRQPDREREQRLAWQDMRKRFDRVERQGRPSKEQLEFRWLLEELRVSLYAQELKTLQPVSLVRLEKRWKVIA